MAEKKGKELAEPYYIIIRGPLGVGKSTIANILAKKLKAEHIEIDRVLEQLKLDSMPRGALCIPLENFIKADEFIFPEARQKLQQGKIIILNACFYHKEHIEHIIDNLKFPHHIFTLKASLSTCIQRDRHRKMSHGKAAAEAVYRLVSRFDYGTVIDTEGKAPGETAAQIMSCLAESL